MNFELGPAHLLTVNFFHLPPDELHTHAVKDRLVFEGQLLEMLRLHVGTEDARGVLKVLLRVNEGHVEVLLAVASHNEAGETAADNEDLKKTRLSADLNIES